MARTTPQVRDGVLVTAHGAQEQTIAVGTAAWHCWLDDAHTTTFRFVHHLATLSARKEHGTRGGSYWYAYLKREGRLHKGYLGRTQDLTLQRLDAVATRLASGAPPRPREQAAATGATPAPDADLAPDPPDTLLATKLYLPPPRPGLVQRPRLTARMDVGLRGPLTLLVAPAGWGKMELPRFGGDF